MPKMPLKSSSKQSLDKKKLLLFAVFLLLVVAAGAGVYYLNSFLTIKTVVINKSRAKSSLQGLNIFTDTNILFLNEKDAEEQLYLNNSYVKNITIQKQLPSTVYLSVNYFSPLAEIEASEGYFILGNTGRILKKEALRDQSLPLIHYYQKLSYSGYKAGDTILFKDIKASLSFLEKAKALGLRINSIDIQAFNMIALNTETQKILFTLEKSEKDQLYQFEKVVQQFKIQGKQFKTLDLRFDRVIIGE